ncbi:MAG: PH domain-containing protein [Parcubacteria group bacterium]|jgi:uncharacterized membrane protein YdbT with pleckstrin-like domain
MRTELKEDEKVFLIIRRHWLILMLPITIAIIGLVIGFFFRGYWLIVPILPLCYLLYRVIERRNDLWAVTNLRVIDEYGVFTLNSKESPLDKINNVSYSQSIWGRLLGYGNVQIQTAAEVGASTYEQVEKPQKLKDAITEMQEEYKKTQISAQAQELAKAIAHNSQDHDNSDITHEIEKIFALKQKGMITEQEFIDAKKKLLDL